MAFMQSVTESLAGRAAIIELEPLSFREARAAHPKLKVEEFLVRGAFRELYANLDIDARGYLQSYVATYLERDLRQHLEVSSLRDFELGDARVCGDPSHASQPTRRLASEFLAGPDAGGGLPIHRGGRFHLADAKWGEQPRPRDAGALRKVAAALSPGCVDTVSIICRTPNAHPIDAVVNAVPVTELPGAFAGD